MPRATPTPAARAAGDSTRERLVAAARDLYLDVGLAGFSLREVARRVGVSAAAVYGHFENKEDLMRAACAEGFEIFFRYLSRSLAAETPRARFEAAAAQYLRFALENPADYRFIFMSNPADLSPGQPYSAAVSPAPTFQFLVDRVAECITAGVLPPADPRELAIGVWGHLHGLASLRLSGHLGRLGPDETFRAFFHDAIARAWLRLFFLSVRLTLFTHQGMRPMPVINRRVSGVVESDVVVFLIGMRVNRWWKPWQFLRVALAMPRMLKELSRHPELGYLGGESWFGRTTVLVSYWKSAEQLLAYAKLRDAQHLPAWRAFNQRVGTGGDVGIWHETYRVPAGSYETVYVNMPPFGLGRAGQLVEASGRRQSASGRLGATGDGPIAPMTPTAER